MSATGRIQGGILEAARRVVFGVNADASIDAELWAISDVDRAHTVMLVERGLLPLDRARTLLTEIEALRGSGFAALRGRPAPRGIYLLYEQHLIARLGVETGGTLHLGRSRNDLNATVLKLRLRAPFTAACRDALRLLAVLIGRARRERDTVMPMYTHYQAALPVTLGHYLAGVAAAFARDTRSLLEAGADLERCPLGAGAGGGTSVAIDASRTARLLGFARPVANSIDGVASRDLVLRLLAALSVMGVTLSRLASDLLLFATAEFGFVELPDEVVGSSSMLPQKRNPFLLEHVQGKSAQALGAFVAAATSMQAKPFTNSIAVGTEGSRHAFEGLRATSEAMLLSRLVTARVRARRPAMCDRASRSYTAATELANRLVQEAGLPFRSAHRSVGEIVSDAIERGEEPLEVAAERWAQRHPGLRFATARLDPASVSRAAEHGGGPGPTSIASQLRELTSEWRALATLHRERRRAVAAAEFDFERKVQSWLGT